MRTLIALAIGLVTAGLVSSQPPAPKDMAIPVRYGLPYREKTFPQRTPKQTLESVVQAVEKADVSYLVSNLLDPTFVDARLAERARQLEPVVETELIQLRQFQKQNSDRVNPEARIPDDPVKLRAMVAERSRDRAFRQLVRDVQDKFIDDPESMKDLRRFLRQGTFPPEGGADTTARVGLSGVTDRAIYFRKIGERWFIENRQVEDGKAPEPKPPEVKKQ